MKRCSEIKKNSSLYKHMGKATSTTPAPDLGSQPRLQQKRSLRVHQQGKQSARSNGTDETVTSSAPQHLYARLHALD
jgi:hypothetical protein